MGAIRYLAVISEEPQALARFYLEEIGMEELDRSGAGDISLTDGYYNLTLFRRRADLMELRKEPGLHHIGMDVESIDEVLAKYRELVPGGIAVREPEGIGYGDVRIFDPQEGAPPIPHLLDNLERLRQALNRHTLWHGGAPSCGSQKPTECPLLPP